MSAVQNHPYQALQDQLLDLAKASRRAQPSAEWLQTLREQAETAFSQNQLPLRKTENWKYSSIAPINTLLSGADQPFSAQAARTETPLEADLVLELGPDGVQLPGALPEGIRCVAFEAAEPEQQARIAASLQRLEPEHPFRQLNAAWSGTDILIEVASKEPVRIQLHYLQSQGDKIACPRVVLDLQEMTRAELVEVYHSANNSAGVAVTATEITLGQGASATHFVVNREAPTDIHIGHLLVEQHRDSRYEMHTLALGGALKRRDIEINLREPGCETSLSGVYLLTGKQHCDFHTTLNHHVPHCISDEVFRGIIGGQAKAVFNGRIHIYPEAQKTQAELSNKNLLLTPSAEVNTKPELEIYADDVRCAHGATVGQLDPLALFYCRSRGISQADAYQMLSHAFIGEVLERIGDNTMKEWFATLSEPFFTNASPE